VSGCVLLCERLLISFCPESLLQLLHFAFLVDDLALRLKNPLNIVWALGVERFFAQEGKSHDNRSQSVVCPG
jgi:hypothetical protein